MDHLMPLDDYVGEIFRTICNSKESTLKDATDSLHEYASVVSHGSGEASASPAEWEDVVGEHLKSLVKTKNSSQLRGAVIAIGVILNIIKEDPLANRGSLFRFYNHLISIMRNTREQSILNSASQLVGKLTEISGNALGDRFVEGEIPNFLEMSSSEESSSFGALLILKEFSLHNPDAFLPHLSSTLHTISGFLRHRRIEVRVTAAELMGNVLAALTRREFDAHRTTITNLVSRVQQGLESNSAFVLHGSLLALRVLFLYTDKDFMHDCFPDMCEAILRFRSHADTAVRGVVISMLSTLATYEPETFGDNFFVLSISFLVERLDSEDGPKACLAIGQLSTVVGRKILPHITPIFKHLKIVLQKQSRPTPIFLDHMFESITLMTSSLGMTMAQVINDHLALLFEFGLSEPFVRMLEAIVKYIPFFLENVQVRLLELLSIILHGRHYRAQGAPPLPEDTVVMQPSTSSSVQTTLALSVLGSFNLKGHLLIEFIVNAVIPHLDNEEVSIRKAAAITTCRLLAQDTARYQRSRYSTELITTALDKVLSVAIVDFDPSVRHAALSNLEINLDYYLSQAEYIRLLMIALHDEVVENRIVAVDVVGRLATHNPAYVLPLLKKTLVRLLTDLRCSVNNQSKENAIRTLAALVTSTHDVVDHRLGEVLEVLLHCAKDPNPIMIARSLICLGQLSAMDTSTLVSDNIPKIMSIVLTSLEGNSQMRYAALDCLGRLCTNTGYVIIAIEENPQLIPLLHGMLKREQSRSVRLQVIKVIGLLGALDPDRYQARVQGIILMEFPPESNNAVPETDVPVRKPTLPIEDPYQDKVFRVLLDILQQNALGNHHHLAVDCFVSIAKTHGRKIANAIPLLIPAFCNIICGARSNLQGYYLGQLAFLVEIFGDHIRCCTTEIVELIHSLWHTSTQRLALVGLVEAMAGALNAEFGRHSARLIPRLLIILQEERTESALPIQLKALSALMAFGSNLQEYLNLVVPLVISCYEHRYSAPALRKQAMQSLETLSKCLDLHPYTSRIVHSLMLIMTDPDEQMRQTIDDVLQTLTYTLGSSFVIFVPSLIKALSDSRYDSPKLLDLFSKLLNQEPLPIPEYAPKILETLPTEPTRLPNRNVLKQAWQVSRVLDTHDAWTTWFTQLAAQFVKESPSVSLQSCMNLLDVYPHIATQLFNPALASCWPDLTEPFQDDLVHSIQHVVSSSSVPPEVAHYMLDLVEYMERNATPLPISHSLMADYCYNHQAYAKALHHRELQFFQDFAPATIEALIDINVKLRQCDAAVGTLNLARQHYDISNPESWYEKLGQWDEAIHLYKAMSSSGSGGLTKEDRNNSLLGQLRCLHALGEWEQVANLTAQVWPQSDAQLRSQLAEIGAASAWHIGAWASLQTYCSEMESTSGDRAFYSAVSAIHRNKLSTALINIDKSRDLLDPELTALLDESPDSLDRFTVQAQMISELEEIVLYKQLANRPHRQQALQQTWKKRLKGCQRDPNVWERILKVRGLAIKPEEDIDTIVSFSNLCRKSGRLRAAERAMGTLVRMEEHKAEAPPQIVYAQLKLIWATGDRRTALASLRSFIQELSLSPQATSFSEDKTIPRILARSHFKQGNWQVEMDGGLNSDNADCVLNAYNMAAKYDSKWSKAWHAWAISNMEMIRDQPGANASPGAEQAVGYRTGHIVAAIEGFFHSLGLTSQNKLPDTLSLLTLWFKYGGQVEVAAAMTKGFNTISCDIWLDVVPQIIARIQTPIPMIKDALTRLLADIAVGHPQALVYPLTVGVRSPSLPRKAAAQKILNQICMQNRILVEQARLVARELSRAAVSWAEMWYDGLQRSGRHYVNGDSKGMVASLQPLYDLMKEPSTLFELEFTTVVGPHLERAKSLCRRHTDEGDKKAFDEAWSIFFRVYQQLEQYMPEFQAGTRHKNSRVLDLQSVAPKLLQAVNLELAVPGTYISGSPLIRITSFKSDVPYFQTKQRPRQIFIKGDNGVQFVYLLKGREDLRQDERVMQVLGLVNTLLARDRESMNRRLHLQRYTVVPLTPDVGLIGWMYGTDTLQNLIIEYRKNHKIIPDLEHRLILQEEPDYDTTAPLARKVQVFESAMNRTTGQDLYRIFWLKSESSENWVTRRTTYTRSLAVGNMICYLLGVGDRHPGNIMIGRKAGKVIHIDFGDCFEVSFERESLPEKVPFRLTRMLRHAMEVCGTQGGYKTSCEISMTVFRDNKESLLAVLEALVYDPLINWRLVRAEAPANPEVASSLASMVDGPNRRTFLNENEILDDAVDAGINREFRNDRALAVYNRVEDKLKGRDFDSDHILSIPEQLGKLVQQATSNENLCQHFHGWCPFW